jgi:hypothetical protein
VTQLRGLVFEQQRVIRTAARQVDHLKETEKILEDDLHKLRMNGCTRKQQQEMEAKWKENSLSEYNRLRAELVASNEEEMLKAIRQVVREKDEQIATLKRQFDAQQLAMNHRDGQIHFDSTQRLRVVFRLFCNTAIHNFTSFFFLIHPHLNSQE